VGELARRADDPAWRVTVDLVTQRVLDRDGFERDFPLDHYRREMLLAGLDEIGVTLKEELRIAAYERRTAALRLGRAG
jgi:3-isopropylmalate/(R)-2-methylmalate dehydratase small subunit